MAEINLLHTEQSAAANIVGRGKYYVARLLTLLLVIVLLAYAYLFIDDKRTASAITKTQAKIAQAQSDALSNPFRGQVITRQGQVKELNTLIKGHLYWSYLLPELARVTLKSSKYTSIEADSTGELQLAVSVASYEEMEKILQIFDLPEYNQQFSNVKVTSINKTQDEQTGVVEIDVRLILTFNPEYIKGRM